MRLVSLDMWPGEPHFDVVTHYLWLIGTVDARAQLALGLYHDDSHLGQIDDIVQQVKAAALPAPPAPPANPPSRSPR